VLPGADAFGAHKHGCGLHIFNLLLKGALPGQAGTQFPFVEPRRDALQLQVFGDFFYRRFVLTVMAEKDIKDSGFRFAFQHRSCGLAQVRLFRS